MATPEPRDARGRCPYCAEAYEGTPAACPHCEEDLGEFHAAAIAREIAVQTRRDAESGAFRHPSREEFRRLRKSTIAFGIAAAVLIGTGLIAGRGRGSDAGLFLAVGGWVFGIVAFLFALALGIGDLLLTPPERILTPEAAMGTYLKCLREGRWEYAARLVVPRARQGRRRRPAVPLVRTPAGSFDLGRPEGLRGWWQGLLRSQGATVRSARVEGLKVERTGEDEAVASCVFVVTAYPLWVSFTVLLYIIVAIVLYLVTRKIERLAVQLRLARVAGRWYLVEPVPALGRREEES